MRRGLLIRDPTGGLSFGHLTYQEYMAAEWLADNDSTSFVWNKLLTPWWRKTIEFSAAIKKDISGLMKECMKYRSHHEATHRVLELVKLTPLTPSPVVNDITVPQGNVSRPEYDWSNKVARPDTI